jgi:hypothetical protein
MIMKQVIWDRALWMWNRWAAALRRGIALAVALVFFFDASIAASGNMDAVNHWAWNDVAGWIDVTGFSVSNAAIAGAAESSIGTIYADSGSYPSGQLPPGVTWSIANDAAGNLSGYAWNDAIGWISLWCGNSSTCATSDYRVVIDDVSGNFSGYAWNDIVGWMSVWCGDPAGAGSCSPVNYRVQTAWRPPPPTIGSLDSSVFDTTVAATFNAILWHGNLNYGRVRFQAASSLCSNGATNAPACNSGGWNFIGSDHTSASWYVGLPGKPILLDSIDHSGKRYIRYRIELTSGLKPGFGPQSPRIHDVIINLSR